MPIQKLDQAHQFPGMPYPGEIKREQGEKSIEQDSIGHVPAPADQADQAERHRGQQDKVHHLGVGIASARQDMVEMITTGVKWAFPLEGQPLSLG